MDQDDMDAYREQAPRGPMPRGLSWWNYQEKRWSTKHEEDNTPRQVIGQHQAVDLAMERAGRAAESEARHQRSRQQQGVMRNSLAAVLGVVEGLENRVINAGAGPQQGTQPRGGTVAPRKPQNGGGQAGGYTPAASTGSASGHNPFAEVIDAMMACKAKFDPHNALVVESWFDGLHQFVEGVVDMMAGHGHKLTEDFYLDPAAGAYATGMSGVFARFQEPVAAAGATFRRVHADDLEKIHSPKPHQDKWDISKNRD